MEETRESVLERRLSTQRLTDRKLPAAADVVRLLGAVQSQEYAHAFWSLGMRTRGATHADVKAAFDAGRFLRTHMLRPTWHFVAAEDIRWMLTATSPRVFSSFGSTFRRLGVDEDVQARTGDLLQDLLRDGNHLTRKEIAVELARRGWDLPGQQLGFVLMSAELRGLVISGPMRGAQHTYALLDERVAPAQTPSREEAVAELAYRFFAGHGPAGLKDLTRWASLTVSEARSAIEACAARLARMEVAGEVLWFDPAEPRPRRAPLSAHLLPLYDEVVLTYPSLNFPVVEGHPHPPDDELFVGSVVAGTRNVGTWRRQFVGKQVLVETALAPGLDERHEKAVDAAVDAMTAFIGDAPR
jgi:hypothetical protein